MKLINALIPVIFTTLAVCLLQPVNGQTGMAVLDISLVSQNPYPAEPGADVSIEIEIENIGYADAKNMVVELIPKDPFRLLPGEEAKKTITQIGPQSSVKKTYDLHVDTEAISSDYKLDFNIYSAQNPAAYSTKSVTVSVQGNPKLVIESVETEPDDIEPGGSVNLKFKIKNIGSGTARHLQAKINSTSAYLVPILSGGLVYIGDLDPGETKEASTKLSIDSLAEYKTYTITLTLEYKDESNNPASDTFDVGIPVTGSIRLDIINIEPNYNRMALDIEVANKGTTDAKSLEAKFVIGNQTIGVDYLSQLKATKKTTFSFPLVSKGQGELIINYVGPGLEQNQVSKLVTLDFQPPSGNGTLSLTIGVIIILIIIYFIWRRFFRKKRHHTHRTHPTQSK